MLRIATRNESETDGPNFPPGHDASAAILRFADRANMNWRS